MDRIKVEYVRENDMTFQTAEVDEDMMALHIFLKEICASDEQTVVCEPYPKRRDPSLSFRVKNENGKPGYRVRIDKLGNDKEYVNE